MLNTDKLSTMMGAPPHMWKEIEINQMTSIHKCYKIAYGAGTQGRRVNVETAYDDESDDDAQIITDRGNRLKIRGDERYRAAGFDEDNEKAQIRLVGLALDSENYLAGCSVLRSRQGAMREPSNAPFRDYETFHASCNFDFWASYFDTTTGDSFLVETARGIISKICQLQSRNQVRSKKGHVPFRKQREHLVPLSLCLHEIKMWCITFLRETNPNDPIAFQEINKRIAFIVGLQEKSVWGDAAATFGQGLRAVAHENLRRVMATISFLLANAEEYCYRRYSHRSIREKLICLYETLKECVLNEARVLSSRFEFEGKLASPKTLALQPLDLLNINYCAHFVSFKNPLNILLYKVFQLKLVKCSLSDNFDSFEEAELKKTLKDWKNMNLFCRRIGTEVIYLMDKKKTTKVLPQLYTPAAAEIKAALRKADTRIPVPDVGKKVIKIAQSALEDKDSVTQVFRDAMTCLAALQDIFPLFYAIHNLIRVSKDAGNVDLYDALEKEVNQVMMDGIDRINLLKNASKNLRKTMFARVVIKEEKLRKEGKRSETAVRIPNFVNNYRYISLNLAKATQESYDKCFKQLVDIAKEAKAYLKSNNNETAADDLQHAKETIDLVLNAAEATNALLNTRNPSKAGSVVSKSMAAQSRNGDLYEESDDEEMGEGTALEPVESRNTRKTKSKKKKRWFG